MGTWPITCAVTSMALKGQWQWYRKMLHWQHGPHRACGWKLPAPARMSCANPFQPHLVHYIWLWRVLGAAGVAHVLGGVECLEGKAIEEIAGVQLQEGGAANVVHSGIG
jgi:hypothetical protein